MAPAISSRQASAGAKPAPREELRLRHVKVKGFGVYLRLSSPAFLWVLKHPKHAFFGTLQTSRFRGLGGWGCVRFWVWGGSGPGV